MFTGTTVRLRAYRSSDREALERVETDPEAVYLAEDGPALPRSERDLDAFLSQASSGGPTYLFVVERLEDGAFLGTVGAFRADWKNRHIEVGISLDRSVWGQGYGTDAMKVLVRVLFNEMNLHKVKLGVISHNPRAQRSYEKVGFKMDGRLREEIYRDGRYYDLIQMSLLRSDWLAAQENQGQ